jgi:hypothetical protein
VLMRNNQIATDSILARARLVTAGGKTMRAEEAILLPARLAVKDKRFCAPQPRLDAGFVRRSKGDNQVCA